MITTLAVEVETDLGTHSQGRSEHNKRVVSVIHAIESLGENARVVIKVTNRDQAIPF